MYHQYTSHRPLSGISFLCSCTQPPCTHHYPCNCFIFLGIIPLVSSERKRRLEGRQIEEWNGRHSSSQWTMACRNGRHLLRIPHLHLVLFFCCSHIEIISPRSLAYAFPLVSPDTHSLTFCHYAFLISIASFFYNQQFLSHNSVGFLPEPPPP